MKRLILIMAAVAVVAFIVGRVTQSGPEKGTAVEEAEEKAWTCSMHLHVRRSEPGQCPICGMDLVPLASMGGAADANALTMSEAAKELARIETAPVERRFPETEVRMVGKVAYDETRVRTITARFPARIDRLYIDYTGVVVRAGDHLAQVYGPELLTAQTELLSSLRAGSRVAIEASREKLRLWGLSQGQIEQIEKRGTASEHLEIDAPIGGIVVEKKVAEGDYVETGTEMFRIADLTQVWVLLDAYESDLPWIRYGQPVQFETEAYAGETFEGMIAFIDPSLNPETRTASVRVNVPNPDGRLKPGMLVRGIVESRIAEGGRVMAPELAGKWISPMHPQIVKDQPGQCDICGMDLVPAKEMGYTVAEDHEPPLVVPVSAVLPTGKRAIVYVGMPERENPTFEAREVQLGPRAGDFYIVRSGLEEGELVVVNGNFKIDSALQIAAKPSMMSAPDHEEDLGEAPPLDAYLVVQAALAEDDFAAAQEAARESDAMASISTAESIEAAREAFAPLSQALIGAVEWGKAGAGMTLYRMHCPMALKNGADWLQRDEEIRNPYYGASMLNCGEVTKTYPAVKGKRTGDDGHVH